MIKLDKIIGDIIAIGGGGFGRNPNQKRQQLPEQPWFFQPQEHLLREDDPELKRQQ